MKSTLDAIKAALDGFDECVYYGGAFGHAKTGKPWNLTVFKRAPSPLKDSLTGISEKYEVSVMREEYVAEEELPKLIAAMSAVPGVKPDASASVQYDYDVKPGTSDSTVELMTVTFAKGRKL